MIITRDKEIGYPIHAEPAPLIGFASEFLYGITLENIDYMEFLERCHKAGKVEFGPGYFFSYLTGYVRCYNVQRLRFDGGSVKDLLIKAYRVAQRYNFKTLTDWEMMIESDPSWLHYSKKKK